MVTKISTWLQWNVGYEPGERHYTLDSETVVDITRLKISQYDYVQGTPKQLQNEFFKSLNIDSEIVLEGIMTQGAGAGKLSSLTLRVSGEPSFIARSQGLYSFPVEPLSSTFDKWNVGKQGFMDLYGPSQTVTPPLVSYAYEPATSLGTSSIEDYTSRSSRWDTREGDIRKQIYRMTQTESNISFIYRESLRSMIASFNDIGYINSDDKLIGTKCIHANAERAIAKLKQENNTILPVLSISQTVSEDDDKRRRNESVLMHDKYWDKDKQRAIRILSLAPRPVTIKYSLNIWAKYMANMDQILEQVRLKFNPEMQVPTKFSTIAKALIESEEDLGKIEAADKEDRVLKKTINITLRTYIPSPKFMLTSTGKIEKFLADAVLL